MEICIHKPTDEEMEHMLEGSRSWVITLPNGMLTYMCRCLGSDRNVNAWIINTIWNSIKRCKNQPNNLLKLTYEQRSENGKKSAKARWKGHKKMTKRVFHSTRVRVCPEAKARYNMVFRMKRIEFMDLLLEESMTRFYNDIIYKEDVVRRAFNSEVGISKGSSYVSISRDMYKEIYDFCSAWEMTVSGFVSACLIMGRMKK